MPRRAIAELLRKFAARTAAPAGQLDRKQTTLITYAPETYIVVADRRGSGPAGPTEREKFVNV